MSPRTSSSDGSLSLPSRPDGIGLAASTKALSELLHAHGESPSLSLQRAGTAERVLLTGAAGFLGVHMLAQLAQEPACKQVYAVVRDPHKVERQLQYYGLDGRLSERIQLIPGDLATVPEASLPSVDTVVHGAARIHALKPLSWFWQDNVQTTQRLFGHYAAQGACLHLVSTLSVFVSSNQVGRHEPVALRPDTRTELYGGYAQSKYVAELIAQHFGAHVIRLGLLTGASSQRIFPPDDFFTTVVRALQKVGTCPATYEPAQVDVTPVDYAARRIARCLTEQSALRPRFTHIANKHSLELSALARALGLRPEPKEAFLARLQRLSGLERTLLHYAFFKSEALRQMPKFFNVDLFQSTGHEYAIEQPFEMSTQALLSGYLSAMAARAGTTAKTILAPTSEA